MRMRVGSRRRALSNSNARIVRATYLYGLWLLAWTFAGTAVRAQEPEDVDLSAKQRILPTVGPGLRAVRQGTDGRLYVLASPSPGLVVVDTKGKQLVSIAESSPSVAGTSGNSGA